MTPEHNTLNHKELSLLKPPTEPLNSRITDDCDPRIRKQESGSHHYHCHNCL